MPKRITKKIGDYAVHKYLNNGIGIILSRNKDRSTLKFENEKIGTYPTASVVELTDDEALNVRIVAVNIRICNRRIREVREAEANGDYVDDNTDGVIKISRNTTRLKELAQKDCNHLKSTYGIEYDIEN